MISYQPTGIDDSAKINLLLDAGVKEFFVEPGIIDVRAPILIPSLLHLHGCEDNTIFRLHDGANCPLFAPKHGDEVYADQRVTLEKFKIDGNRENQDNLGTHHGIYTGRGWHWSIRDLSIVACDGCSITTYNVDTFAGVLEVAKVSFYQDAGRARNKWNLFSYSDSRITICQFQNDADGWFAVELAAPNQVLSDSKFHNCYGLAALGIRGAYQTLSGLSFLSSQKAAIRFANSYSTLSGFSIQESGWGGPDNTYDAVIVDPNMIGNQIVDGTILTEGATRSRYGAHLGVGSSRNKVSCGIFNQGTAPILDEGPDNIIDVG